MRRSTFLVLGGLLGACSTDTFTGDDGGVDANPDVPGITGGDGSTDAPTDAKDAGPKLRFCQSVDAQFCADFDIPNDAGAGFLMPPNVTTGFGLEFESAMTKSYPVAVRATEPGDAAGTAYLSTALGAVGDGGASSSIALDLDVYLPALTVSSTQALFAFAIGAAGPTFQWGLATEGKGVWRLENLQTSNGPQLSGTIATGEWAHANLTITLSPTSGTVTCTVTSSAGTATIVTQGVTSPSVGALPVMLNVGLQTNGPANQAAPFLYDNVVVHYQ